LPIPIGVCIVLLLVVAGIIASNPLRRSEAHIRSKLLRDTPLGTDLTAVHQYIIRNGWKISYVREDGGFLDQRTAPSKSVGEKSIRASLGDYQDLPFKANVTVFWGFDEDSRLIDVWVWKTRDGL
jgi:hypothetical protein